VHVEFFDCYTNYVNELIDSMYYELEHLNINGARVYSNILIDSIYKSNTLLN
jgi:hypothetical protein